MGTLGAVFIVVIFLIAIELLGELLGSSGASSTSTKEKDEVRLRAPNKIKCKCLECNQVVMIPKQYLDLSYRGPQTAKCPNCDWKMRKVKIIQTWGLE